MEYLYHLTEQDCVNSILQQGLKANKSKQIFALTLESKVLFDKIAFNQIFCKNYSVIRIDKKGITGKIIIDNVAELTAVFQVIILQKHIKPKYLEFLSNNTVSLAQDLTGPL